MLRFTILFGTFFCLLAVQTRIVKGCHAGHSQQEETDYDEDDDLITVEGEDDSEILSRKRRQVEQSGDDFAILRRYFRDCMLDKVVEPWDWKSIIDFTILKTLWYLYSGSVACSEKSGKDNSECWNACIDAYLKNSSNLISSAKECVIQYELDYSRDKASYTPTFPDKKESLGTPRQEKYLECVQTQYNEADPESVFQSTGVLVFPPEEQLDIFSVAAFVRDHVRCVICDFSNLPNGLRRQDFRNSYEINGEELVDGTIVYNKTWPFSFEALIRRDARLRYAINFCNGEYEGTFRKDPPPSLGWTQWYIWGSCNAACHSSGIQTRIRVCLDESGKNCKGKNSEKRVCRNNNCAEWSEWSRYTPCLSTCDVSEQYSFRYCKNGNVGDEGCQGPRRRTRSCAVSSCEVPWTQWSACSATCGSHGFQYRSGGESLLSVHTENRKCNLHRCPEKWTLWSPWGPCSRTCGNGGKRERVRKCLSETCSGQSMQSLVCFKPPCHNGWSQWTPWSDCVYKRRTRVCHGQENCRGESESYRLCPSTFCAAKTQKSGQRWSEWSNWSRCDAVCGPGQRGRYRNCLGDTSRLPSSCVGKSAEFERCSNMPCRLPKKQACRDQYGHCRQIHSYCNREEAKVWCRKTCGFC